MKLIYIVDFPISGNSGKSKATREKAQALRNILGPDNFVFIIPRSSKKTFLSKIYDTITFDLKTVKQLFSIKNDYVVIQRVSFNPLTTIYMLLKGIKFYSEFHADFHDEIPYLNKTRIEKFILYFLGYLYNWKYYINDGIIYNHPILKEEFDSVYKKPSIFSYNGASSEEFLPHDKNKSRKNLGLLQEDVIFLFIGSVSIWHGVDFLVTLFNHPDISRQKNWKLYVVGAKNTEYVASLKSLSISKNIVFVPPVDTVVANQYINASDYCLLPVNDIRKSPGSPLKLYDYISCGKPVIAQEKVLGYCDEVRKYDLGYCVDFTSNEKAPQELIDIVRKGDIDDFKKNRDVAINLVNWKNRMFNWVQFVKNADK